MNKRQPHVATQPRSPSQRQINAALSPVMRAWDDLPDNYRRAWNNEARARRTKGVHLFKKVNLRRLERGQDLLLQPPPPDSFSLAPILKRLIIHNHRGRLRLELELHGLPEVPTTLWGALPCNRGRARPIHCPRLGWLESPATGRCDITPLYYAKYGNYLRRHAPELPGKRIAIRARQESNYAKALFEEIQAVIPAPEPPPTPRKTP